MISAFPSPIPPKLKGENEMKRILATLIVLSAFACYAGEPGSEVRPQTVVISPTPVEPPQVCDLRTVPDPSYVAPVVYVERRPGFFQRLGRVPIRLVNWFTGSVASPAVDVMTAPMDTVINKSLSVADNAISE